MVWHGSSSVKDRVFASLPYLVPILEVIGFGGLVFSLIPPLIYLFFPLFLIMPIYYYSLGGLAIVEIAVFFALYALVVRNSRLPHFLRFNTIQALLLSIFSFLCRLLLQGLNMSQTLFSPVMSGSLGGNNNLLSDVLVTIIFLGVAGVSGFAIVQSLRGKYAEIPLISEAAYEQVRW